MRKYFIVLIFFTFFCFAKNVFAAPPKAPDIGGTIWIWPGGTTANIVKSVDPEGQNVMYEVDWDGNGTVDGTTAYAASGAVVNIGTVAPSSPPGGFTFKVRAKDTAGEYSAWSSYFVDGTYSCEWGYGSNPKGAVFGTPIIGQPVDFMVANCYVSGVGYSYPLYTGGNYASGGPTGGNSSYPTSGQPNYTKVDSWMERRSYAAGITSDNVTMARLDQYGNDTGLGPVDVVSFNLVNPINGTCGSSNGGTFSSAPTTNLCSAGTNSPVTGTGPWNWGCYGNYQQAVSCNANVITSYNCEAGTFNPSLNIQTGNSNSVIGFLLSAASRAYHSVFGGACFYNSGSSNLFVPTKTAAELNSFINHLPAGVSKANGGW